MKLFFAVSFCLLAVSLAGSNFRLGRSKDGGLGAPAGCRSDDLPKARWFEQNLDHFTRPTQRTWKQRYFVNDTFYDPTKKSPVFLLIEGEGPANPQWAVKGSWIDYAQEFGALCIVLEHRFYGESHPTSDMSVKNLAYLSSEQALADIATFIAAMNSELPAGSRWVVFGGSYPGSLAAWARLKYPHLIHGAVSSSGPLLAQVDFDKYFQVVVDALKEKTGSDACEQQIRMAHKQIVSLIATKQADIVEKAFRVCKPFSGASSDDMRQFYNTIADCFAEVVQYNEDNRIGQSDKYKNVTINTICNMLTEPGSEMAYEKLAKFSSLILDKSNQTCLDYDYKNSIEELRNTSWAAGSGRPWMYQTCNEFGFYQTSSAETAVFGDAFPVDFFIQQCEEIFGQKFNKQYVYAGARWTNTNYGALNISISNVVFVHGTVDPWHALGLTRLGSADPSSTAILIKGTAHCANMYPPSAADPPALRAARQTIKKYIARWLKA